MRLPPAVGAAKPVPTSHDGYKPYLDGVRAIAVGGVVVYHLNRAWLPGGYLGVDLFFVLSGYLITSLLIAEHGRSGRISLPAFWSRRARRLLPALLVLLLVLSVDVALNGDPLAVVAARGDFLAALFYVANWHFIATSQSYFAQYAGVSLVRHTWSLAIEEQFYIAWPLVVAVVMRLAGLRWLGAVAAALSVASVTAMWFLFDPSDPSRAYFGTDSRIFEILVGALLAAAVSGPWRGRVLSASRTLALPALAVIAAAFILLADDNALYYHGASLGLVIAGALLIAGLEAGAWVAKLLSLRPLVAVGVVSYGVYLWHFPITVFIQTHWGSTSEVPMAALAVAATAAVAVASFFLVERPVRRGHASQWLTRRRLVTFAPAASGLVAVSILLATNGAQPPTWAATGSPASQIFVPQVQSSDAAPPWTLGVVGDSVMNSAMPGFEAEAQSRGWTLIPAAFDGCPVGYQPLYDSAGNRSPFDCSGVASAYSALMSHKPDLIIWEDLQSVLSRRAVGGALLPASSPAWTDSLVAEWRNILDGFLATGADVVIILPPLRSQDAAGCAHALLVGRCKDIQSQDSIIRAATEALWAQVSSTPGVHLVVVDPLLCPNGYPCPRLVQGIEVRLSGWDQTHFTSAGAAWYAPRLLDEVMSLLDKRRRGVSG